MQTMQPIKPYLIRAYYDWICDSHLTPHVLVQANLPNVIVPTKFVDPDDGTIVLNISAVATNKLLMNNHMIQFQARFDNAMWEIEIPYYAVAGIYADENDEGVYFQIDPSEIEAIPASATAEKPAASAAKKTAGHPHLRVIKNEE